MGSDGQIHVLIFPLMAYGHMIPSLDIARLFASRGAKITIATTPLNASVFTGEIDETAETRISIRVYPFPSKEAGVPEGVENLEKVTDTEMVDNFLTALDMLEGTLEDIIKEVMPDCIIADSFFPWATDIAAKFDIPRLVFHGTGFFPFCVSVVIETQEPYSKVSSDDEEFPVPGLPHELRLTRTQLPSHIFQDDNDVLKKLLWSAFEADKRSFGVIFNSFYELEPAYVDYFRQVFGRKAWHVGPVSLSNRSMQDKVQRGKKAAIDEHKCLKWLDSKEPDSVIYLSFGSISRFSISQLHEIAHALDAFGRPFIWVVRGGDIEEAIGGSDPHQWFPEDFEKKVEGKGLIIRGWAPQVLILDHKATGAFVTHCGWNSMLEGISSGVPMVTWPVFAEQFYNEKLITEILKNGVQIGARQWTGIGEESAVVKKEAIENALRRMVDDEEGAAMRNKARELKELAWKAIQEGGSSYSDLSALLQVLNSSKA